MSTANGQNQQSAMQNLAIIPVRTTMLQESPFLSPMVRSVVPIDVSDFWGPFWKPWPEDMLLLGQTFAVQCIHRKLSRFRVAPCHLDPSLTHDGFKNDL